MMHGADSLTPEFALPVSRSLDCSHLALIAPAQRSSAKACAQRKPLLDPGATCPTPLTTLRTHWHDNNDNNDNNDNHDNNDNNVIDVWKGPDRS